MAKDKGKRSSGVDLPAENGENVASAPLNSADTMPTLDATALANLTKNIERKLQGGNPTSGTPRKKGAKATPGSDKKRKDNGNKNQAKPKNESRPKNDAKADTKGKKRDRNGEVIARKATEEGKQPGEKKDVIAEDELRQEILALGGSKEDYDMIAGLESDSEVEGAQETDEANLRQDLAKMLAGAGHIQPPESDDISDVDENGDISDVEDEIEEETEEEPEQPAPKKAPKMTGANLIQMKGSEQAEGKLKDQKAPRDSRFTVEPRPDWYASALPEIGRVPKKTNDLSRHLVDRIKEHAMSLLSAENDAWSAAQKSSSASSHKFYSTIMTSGTLSDKISALTLAVQESPIHNLKGLETLVGLAKKRSRAQAVEVLRSLKDLFAQGTLLPGDRKLRYFANQPSLVAVFQNTPRWSSNDALPGELKPCHLIVWAFEDRLKDLYFEILKILEVWCNDEIEFSRSRAISYVFELLKEKPEQESNLLRLLVNKLGDPNKKIASRASYLLLQLEQTHPLMKYTVISAIEAELLFRPGQSQHAKYYGLITLNQSVLNSKDENVAQKLLNIYFGLFVTLLKPAGEKKGPAGHKQDKFSKKGKHNKNVKEEQVKGQAQDDEMREKLISAVLTGVNRAYPFTDSDSKQLEKHLDTLFKITHSSNFNTSIQALLLIQQLTSVNQVSADRFYRTLYESLLDPRVATSSKQSLYLNLLYKALKNDLSMRRVKAFIKRMIQILGLHQPGFICGIFFLIKELEKTFPSLKTWIDQPEEHDSDDEEVFRDVPDEDDEGAAKDAEAEKSQKPNTSYDSRKRDPEHSNADKSCLWELLPLLSHFHPSVSVSASQIFDHLPMSGKPDLTLHTLTHFLDRFVYRNPKASSGLRGSSIMQPLAGGDASGLLLTSGAGTGKVQTPVNSEAFWKQRTEDVAADDVFFHDYFNRLGKDKDKARSRKDKKKPTAGDDEEGESDGEAEIWKALVESRPEIEGDDESDDDLDLDDLESAMGEDNEDEDEEDGGVIFNDEDDEEEEEQGEDAGEEEEAAETKLSDDEMLDEDTFDMDVSDDEAFRDSDDEVPSDLEQVFETEATSEKDEKRESQRQKRRKLKHLPTFASADDYAALLAAEEDGM